MKVLNAWLKQRLAVAIILACSLTVASAGQGAWGHFNSSPEVRLDATRRNITLLRDLVYTDPKGTVWLAPAGSVSDGASIPPAFWGVIGGPLDDQYRDASIIHDVACQTRDRPWEDAALAFYCAMRCRGVGNAKAKIMYYAVYHFGPRWGIANAVRDLFGSERQATSKDVRQISQWVHTANPSLDQIENTNPALIPKR